jgi:hypothetical protein
MTDQQGRGEILSSGPGEPAEDRRADRWPADAEPAVLRAERPESAEGEPADQPARGLGAWRAVLEAVVAPPALAITGLLLVVLPLLGLNALVRLAAALGTPENPPTDGSMETAPLTTAMTGLSVGTTLLGVAAGLVALRRSEPEDRGFRAVAGAAVLVGLFGAAIHLAVTAAGGPGAYYLF